MFLYAAYRVPPPEAPLRLWLISHAPICCIVESPIRRNGTVLVQTGRDVPSSVLFFGAFCLARFSLIEKWYSRFKT